MNARRFRPTLDTLPSRVTPSDFGMTLPETASLSGIISEAETTMTFDSEIDDFATEEIVWTDNSFA